MKFLQDYVQDGQTKAFKKAGAFFCFGNQFETMRIRCVLYVSIGGGLVCPKHTADKLVAALNRVSKEGMAQDLRENGREKIIHRELANTETQLTGDLSDCIQRLLCYGITKREIEAQYVEYYAECVKHDWF